MTDSPVTADNGPASPAAGNKIGDNKIKIGIMAGVLALLVVVFVCLYLLKGNTPPPAAPGARTLTPNIAGKSPTPVGTPTPKTPGAKPLAHPPVAGAKPSGNAGKLMANARPPINGLPTKPLAGSPAGAKPAAPKSALPPPPLPRIAVAKAITSAVFDPFAGGPMPPKPPTLKPWPALVMISAVPPVLPQNLDYLNNRNNPTVQHPVEPQVGRMAGWIYNNNGQIIAIFEDADGIARNVHVGDKVNDLTVTTITPESMELVDSNGVLHKLKMQGLDSYSGPNRTVNVTTTPAASSTAPTWGGQ